MVIIALVLIVASGINLFSGGSVICSLVSLFLGLSLLAGVRPYLERKYLGGKKK